ncbi:DUF4384 domain-containing protein [Seleniivibrio woodruffii]|uniref:DUF4384 domain-containing protein n=1 Tax=Seleniivibrio woodruffii TaxID=1078050 RepID=UPI0039E306FF
MKTILIALLLLISVGAFAAEPPITVEAEGTSVMGDADTIKETYTRALNDAQRNALETATGIFIKTRSLVLNSQLAEDLIYTAVKGRIIKYDILSKGFAAGTDREYVVKIKAVVEPYHPERTGGFSVDLALSKSELKAGDIISISYKVTEDAYVYLFSIAADGSVTLLLPNSVQRNNFAEKGKTYVYPDKDSKIVLTAQLLPGFKGKFAEERVKIIASKRKDDLLTLGFQEGMFITYDASSTGMMNDLVRRLNRLDPSEWTDSTVTYKISN